MTFSYAAVFLADIDLRSVWQRLSGLPRFADSLTGVQNLPGLEAFYDMMAAGRSWHRLPILQK